MRNISLGQIVGFLTNVKSNLLCDFVEDRNRATLGGCGALAAADYLDAAVEKLLSMQTAISGMDADIELLKADIKEYETAFGCLDDFTEGELETAAAIVKRHDDLAAALEDEA